MTHTDKGLRQKTKFPNIPNITKQRTNSNREDFKGPYGSGFMDSAAATWVPMGGRVPTIPPNDDPNPYQSPQRVFGNSRISKYFKCH